MTKEMKHIELNIVPGMVQGKGKAADDGQAWEVSIPARTVSLGVRATILEKLSECPADLYTTLQGEMPPWLEDLLAPEDDLFEGDPTCSCKQIPCPHIEEVVAKMQQRLTEEPLLRVALLGLPREELMAGVFELWADEMPPVNGKLTDDDFSDLEEQGKSGPTPGEWLAEAMEQGRLHEPGAAYRDVAVSLKGVPAKELKEEDWSELLPKVTSVRQIVRKIKSEAAVKAKERSKHITQE